MVIGTEKSRTACLKEVESNPILMGEQMQENSASEKYLGDRINEQCTAASIMETIDSRLPIAIAKGKEILKICEIPQLMGFPTAIGPISEYETKLVPKLLNKAKCSQ